MDGEDATAAWLFLLATQHPTDVRRSLSNVNNPCAANDTTKSWKRTPLYSYMESPSAEWPLGCPSRSTACRRARGLGPALQLCLNFSTPLLPPKVLFDCETHAVHHGRCT